MQIFLMILFPFFNSEATLKKFYGIKIFLLNKEYFCKSKSCIMKNITLISDWKLKDPYVGMFKGRLCSLIPDISIFDISHSIELFNTEQTAFILKSSFSSFPENTLHIILSNVSLSEKNFPVLVEHCGHFFLGEDNGVFSLMFGSDSNDKAIQYADNEKKNIFTEKVLEMAKWFFENDLATHTVEYPQYKRKLKVEPDYNPESKIITGKIAYIDSSCNAVTDIPIAMFKEAGRNRKFTAMISNRKHLKITRYHEFYNPEEDEVFFVFNRLGYLEITMFQGNIAILGNLMVGDTVEIKFY